MKRNKRFTQGHAGYTLLETLITLGLICLLLLLPVISLDRLYRQYQVHFFFTQFEKNMAFTQQAAIVSGRTATVHYHERQCDFMYQWYQDVTKTTEVKLPQTIETSMKEVSVNFKAGKGNVDKLPKFTFIDKENKKKYTYQINMGSGKYEKKVEELL